MPVDEVAAGSPCGLRKCIVHLIHGLKCALFLVPRRPVTFKQAVNYGVMGIGWLERPPVGPFVGCNLHSSCMKAAIQYGSK